MAKLKAKCPRCRERIELDGSEGNVVVCPKCRTSLRAPRTLRAAAQQHSLVGKRLGQYELLELLGRGAMGAVYKARQTALGRTCAVKVLPKATAQDPSFVERFQREARAAAAISHPNVVGVFEVGEEDGTHFIAMEYVDGEHLGARLRREGRIPPDEAQALLEQVASALAAAQDLGIVHRDLKPANILVDASGQAKVADFGLAKRSGVDISVTAPGARLGTPLYFAPEMARGQRADARSDLYSLGATFYHLVAGFSPFKGASMADTMLKHLKEPVPPLGSAAPDAPASLVFAIHRLLEKEPDARYQTARELLDVLRGGPATQAPEAPAPERGAVSHLSLEERRAARRKRQRRTAIVLAIAGGAILLAAVLFVLLRP